MINVGLHVLDTQGLAALSLRGAAEIAGVSRAAPKNHFGDKQGLLAAIAARGYALLRSRTDPSLLRSLKPEARLRAIIRNYVAFAMERPALFHLMFGPIIPDVRDYPELEDAAARSYRGLATTVDAIFVARGKRPKARAAFAVWGAMHGLATLLSDRRKAPKFEEWETSEKLCDEMSDLVLRGLT